MRERITKGGGGSPLAGSGGSSVKPPCNYSSGEKIRYKVIREGEGSQWERIRLK